jgi:phage-related protein
VAETNFDIVFHVIGGQVASGEIQGVAKSTDSVATSSEEATKQTSNLRRAVSAAAIAAGAYKAFGFLKGAVQDTTDLAKATAGLQRVTGMDTQTAAGWVEMGKLRNVQSKQLNQGFITFSRQIAGAEQNSKAAKTAFDQLGISQHALGQMNTQQSLMAVADAFQKMPANANKAALAQRLFGRQSQTLLPLLNEGGKRLAEQTAEMGKNSGMTKQGVKDSLAYAAQQRKLAEAMNGIKVAVGTALIPVLTSLSQIIAPIAQGFAKLMQTSPVVRTGVMLITGAITALVPVLLAANAGFITLNAEWIWIPAAIGAVVVAVMLLWNKCAWFRDAVKAVVDAIKAAALWVWNFVKSNWPLLVGLLAGPFGVAVALIITHWKTVKQAISDVFSWLKGAVQTAANFVTGIFGGAFNAVKKIVDGLLQAIKDVINAISKVTGLAGKIGGGIVGAGKSALHTATFGLLQEGGTVTSSGLAMVGEAGPELVHLPRGANVVANHQAASVLSGTNRIVVPVYLDKRQIALAMGDYVSSRQASR